MERPRDRTQRGRHARRIRAKSIRAHTERRCGICPFRTCKASDDVDGCVRKAVHVEFAPAELGKEG